MLDYNKHLLHQHLMKREKELIASSPAEALNIVITMVLL